MSVAGASSTIQSGNFITSSRRESHLASPPRLSPAGTSLCWTLSGTSIGSNVTWGGRRGGQWCDWVQLQTPTASAVIGGHGRLLLGETQQLLPDGLDEGGGGVGGRRHVQGRSRQRRCRQVAHHRRVQVDGGRRGLPHAPGRLEDRGRQEVRAVQELTTGRKEESRAEGEEGRKERQRETGRRGNKKREERKEKEEGEKGGLGREERRGRKEKRGGRGRKEGRRERKGRGEEKDERKRKEKRKERKEGWEGKKGKNINIGRRGRKDRTDR